ncbi:MAG: hypothetical protein JG776_897 [Caloramator sp.]|jgi:uncharacterized membrane protein YheB (UPF0754 family)|uniref:DUF445 family protein n=1 Tax=Caloramator sp. TaxID=1871330 RepID=UPI001DAD18BF|nr:DUF445 family protein [Caloramator sp.]MBZ4663195.1 hypothetical protein [Caloramator sp.]
MKFLVPMVVGALIGYITNYLAIKMLFRPHYEKRVFGIKIPFTPGLIPKEKQRIAKSVGEAVGTHLLSTDVFVDALCSNQVKEQVVEWLKNRFYSLKNSSRKVFDLLNILGDKRDKVIDNLKNSFTGFIVEYIKKDNNRILELINEQINLKETLLSILDSVDVKLKIKDIVNNVSQSNQALKEVIPSSLDGSIKIYIYSNKDKIAKGLLEALSKENVREKISHSAAKMVENTLGKFAAMFLSPELIGEKIISSLQGYISSEENHHDIAMMVIALYEKLTETKVNDIFISFSDDSKEDIVEKLSNAINSYVKDLIYGFNIEEALTKMAYNDELYKVVNMAVSYIVDSFMNIEVSSLLSNIEEDELDAAFNALDGMFEEFIRDKASRIIGLIDVSKLVEDRINSFDVAFAEKIILEVASKELSAITWLGALLGAIMGIISPLLQTL